MYRLYIGKRLYLNVFLFRTRIRVVQLSYIQTRPYGELLNYKRTDGLRWYVPIIYIYIYIIEREQLLTTSVRRKKIRDYIREKRKNVDFCPRIVRNRPCTRVYPPLYINIYIYTCTIDRPVYITTRSRFLVRISVS